MLLKRLCVRDSNDADVRCPVVSYTLDIEAVSCDEMFIDCVDMLADTASSPLNFASLLRREIYEGTGCTASVGIGSSLSFFSYHCRICICYGC